jgi:hypothetical protein
MEQKTAEWIVNGYAILLGALALAGAGLFIYVVWQMLKGAAYSAQAYVQAFLLIPTVILFVYLCFGLFRRKEYAFSLIVAVLYSLIVMTLVIMVLLVVQYSMTTFVTAQFILFILLAIFFIVSAYLFAFNKDVKTLFESKPAANLPEEE